MKIVAILMLGSVLILSQACAQTTTNVPAKVKTAFAEKFTNAKKIRWDKENETEWEAEFKMNGQEYSANFTADGIWKETELEIKKSKTPTPVKATLESQFEGFDIEEVEISETIEGKIYEFALEKDDTDLEIAISSEGKVMKKEVMKKDVDDEEDN